MEWEDIVKDWLSKKWRDSCITESIDNLVKASAIPSAIAQNRTLLAVLLNQILLQTLKNLNLLVNMTHWSFIIRDCVLIKPGKYKTFPSLSSLTEALVREGIVPYKIKRNPIFLKIIANQIVLSLMQDAQIGEIFF